MDYVIKDKRFDHVQKDPRFKKMPVGQRKVKIDKRFKGMFKDKRFKLKYSVDKRGKPMNHTTNENLKKFYELSDQDDSDSDTEAMGRQVVNDSENSDNDSAMTSVKEKQNKKKTKKKKLPPQTTDKRFQVSNIDNDSDESDQEIEIPESGNKKILNKSSAKKNKNKIAVKTQEKKNKKEIEVEPENSEEDLENDGEDGPSASDDDDDVDNSDSDDEETAGQKSGIDLARGEGNVVSSSSEEDDDDDADTDSNDDDDDDQQDDSKFDHGWGENDKTIISLDEATYRLAVCNMDWDRMKAKDIFVLLNSFKPSNGLIKSVKVYPSEYGKERMAEETAHGPRELKEMTIDEDGVSETVEGTSYHREKLREYQLNRLKYYYAVVECDSVQTADAIYNECDGLEYESSATKLDLRFIPDEETFNEDEVKTVCTNIPSNYKPQYFLNAALTQTKVELTWDETDHERVNLTTQHLKGEDIEEEDLKAYLASSSDEESGAPDYGALLGGDDDDDDDDDGSGDEDKKINKYKQLLTDIASDEKKKKGDVEMEISWEPGLREATEKIVKKKKEGKNKTVWEDYLERKKEKKRQKIEERKKKKEKKHADSGSESDSDKDQETQDGPIQTFSDDDVDEDMAAFMAEETDQPPKQKKNKNKKKKKKKGETEETEESSKEKAELALLMMDEENKKHFSLRDLVTEDGKKKKKKNKKELMKKNMAAKGDEEDFKVNVEDPRFSAVFDSHLYNIDPSAPEYRKTKGTEAIVSEKIKRISKKDKQKRSHPGGGDQNVKKQKLTDSQPKKDESLASLIKSVKSKTAHFHGNKSKSKR